MVLQEFCKAHPFCLGESCSTLLSVRCSTPQRDPHGWLEDAANSCDRVLEKRADNRMSVCIRCSAPASFKCPVCIELGVPPERGAFCGQDCYKAAWKVHKRKEHVQESVTSPAPAASANPTQTVSAQQQEGPWPFTVVDIPGKGKGAIASRHIAIGERILAERPILTLDWDVSHAEAEAASRRLLPAERAAMHALCQSEDAHGSERTALGIFLNNALPLGPGSSTGGLCPTAARLNHSCVPSVEHSWNELLGMQTLHASRDIEAGEELCITYMDMDMPGKQERAERQQHLAQKFGFACACEACSLQGPALELSDRRRRDLCKLDAQIYTAISKSRFDLGVKLVQRKIELLQEERLDVPVKLQRAAFEAFQACKHGGQHELAREWLQKALTNCMRAQGPDSPSTAQFQRMLMRPVKAPYDACA